MWSYYSHLRAVSVGGEGAVKKPVTVHPGPPDGFLWTLSVLYIFSCNVKVNQGRNLNIMEYLF